MLRERIRIAVWSIATFKTDDFFAAKPTATKLRLPSLQAGDVTDVPAEFVADPFLVYDNAQFYMFFEVFNKLSERGEIGVASSSDGESWHYQQIVIKENYHLSYPYVFKQGEQCYLIPESAEANGVFLYRATSFPCGWEKVCKLIDGKFLDPSIFYYENKWWMFVGTASNDLHLFYSDHLLGSWVSHPQNPVISNNCNNSRPAGRVIITEGELYRFAQDGDGYYGKLVRTNKIKQLSETTYEEEEINITLSGSNQENEWRKDGMHHIDHLKISDQQWLVAVDGHLFRYQNKIKWKAKRFLRKPLSSTVRFINTQLKRL